jgi:hypothetical protein
MQKLLIGCTFLALSIGVSAEYRTWEDRDGNKIEAEFVRELFDKVTLRKKDGSEVRMNVEEFSDLDQKYFRVMVPPEIEVSARTSSDIVPKEWERWPNNDQKQRHKVTVTISKKSRRQFTSRLKAELFLVAKEYNANGNYILLTKTDSDFLFSEKNDDTHVFTSNPGETEIFKQKTSNQLRGETLEGYLLVVSDMQGNILETKTDIPGDWIEKPEVIANLRELAIRGAASVRSRHFDKTGKRAEVPRVNDYPPPND